jgi:serine/threonine protein phosphatase 1
VDDRAPRVPPGERVYAVGDLHGRADLLDAMDARITADLAERPASARVIRVYLGDYVDRGPDSRGVIDRLARAQRGVEPPVCLMGNHDWWFRDFLETGVVATAWLASGGDTTLASYGVVDLPAFDDERAWAQLANRLRRRMPVDHRRFLNGLATRFGRGDYLFAHAGIRPGLALDRQETRDLLFIREPFLSEPGDLGVVVVHGHTVVDEPAIRRNRIGIDTGAYWTDRLTAVVLEDDTMRFLVTEG